MAHDFAAANNGLQFAVAADGLGSRFGFLVSVIAHGEPLRGIRRADRLGAQRTYGERCFNAGNGSLARYKIRT
jgi:hypothetical protein